MEKLDLDGKYRSYFFQDRKNDQGSVISSMKKMVKNGIKTVLNLLKSTDEVIEGPSVKPGGQELFQVEPMTEKDMISLMVMGGLKISPAGTSKIVTIGYTHKNPLMAQMGCQRCGQRVYG